MGEGRFTAGEKIRRRITLKKGVIESENGIDMDEIISGLRHIAFGSSADAIKLLLHSDTLTGRQIKKLDTFNIASIKQTGSCISEIKFFDRGKAMEKLARHRNNRKRFQGQKRLNPRCFGHYAASQRGGNGLCLLRLQGCERVNVNSCSHIKQNFSESVVILTKRVFDKIHQFGIENENFPNC